jgi:hypothetical protein
MIKGLMGSKGVIVSGGNTSLPYVGPNVNNPMTGMIRINNTELEVFNGSNWQMISSSYATVELDAETQRLLEYVRKQQKEDDELRALVSEHYHPAVRIAQENLNKVIEDLERAKKQLKATVILSKEHNETAS